MVDLLGQKLHRFHCQRERIYRLEIDDRQTCLSTEIGVYFGKFFDLLADIILLIELGTLFG